MPLGLRAIVIAPNPAPMNVRPSTWMHLPRMTKPGTSSIPPMNGHTAPAPEYLQKEEVVGQDGEGQGRQRQVQTGQAQGRQRDDGAHHAGGAGGGQDADR